MPCYDGRENELQILVDDEDKARLRKEWTHNSPVAELLCWTLGHMEKPTLSKFLAANVALARWWQAHRERDDKKLAAENAAKRKKLRRIRELEAELKNLRG